MSDFIAGERVRRQLEHLASNQDSPAQTWGNVGMPANNYFAGQFRNDFDFGVATNGENSAAATNLNYALNARWPDLVNFVSPAGTGKNGSLGYGLLSQEGGGEYGRYSLNYYALAMSSATVMGRDLGNETTAFQSGVLQTIYNTMLAPTTSRGMWDLFTWADDENWVNANGCGYISHNATGNTNTTGGCGAESQYYGDFMQAAAMEYGATNVGKYARQWLAMVKPAVGPLYRSVDTGGTALAFSNLPFDYYSSGARYMYAHDAWATTGTAMLWQMGLNQGANPSMTSALGTGHYHQDAGTFQVSRKGVNVIRETPAYGETVAGFGGAGTVDAATGFAHNIPLVGGQASINLFGACADGPGVVKRLETQPGYAFAVTDLTLTYQNKACDSGHSERQNPYAAGVVREYYYFRGIARTPSRDFVVDDIVEMGTGKSMGTPFLSEIRIVALELCRQGVGLTNGQALPINQNQALFAILGTTYGGNGTNDFPCCRTFRAAFRCMSGRARGSPRATSAPTGASKPSPSRRRADPRTPARRRPAIYRQPVDVADRVAFHRAQFHHRIAGNFPVAEARC